MTYLIYNKQAWLVPLYKQIHIQPKINTKHEVS